MFCVRCLVNSEIKCVFRLAIWTSADFAIKGTLCGVTITIAQNFITIPECAGKLCFEKWTKAEVRDVYNQNNSVRKTGCPKNSAFPLYKFQNLRNRQSYRVSAVQISFRVSVYYGAAKVGEILRYGKYWYFFSQWEVASAEKMIPPTVSFRQSPISTTPKRLVSNYII